MEEEYSSDYDDSFEWDEESYPSECLNCGASYDVKHVCPED